nr:hypothetical protein [Streptomyces cahuitamycinicus]
MFVHDHDASAAFYGELLNMKVTVRTATAALLVSRNGFQVYLRTVGANAMHPVGHVGAQYVMVIPPHATEPLSSCAGG